jgi:predicted sulfurtransferase
MSKRQAKCPLASIFKSKSVVCASVLLWCFLASQLPDEMTMTMTGVWAFSFRHVVAPHTSFARIRNVSINRQHVVQAVGGRAKERDKIVGTGPLLSSSSTNNDLAEERLRIVREKSQTRKQYLEIDRQRNLELKRLLHTNVNAPATDNDNSTNGDASASRSLEENASFQVPPMFALKVSVDASLRQEFNMNGREKRGRVFIPFESAGCQSLGGLKQELHSFFRCLKKSTFVLSAALPEIVWSEKHSDKDNGGPLAQVIAPAPLVDDDNNTITNNNLLDASDIDTSVAYWPVESDKDVMTSFDKALHYFESHNETVLSILKRPTLVINVSRNPDYVPPPTPDYLLDMASPQDTPTMSMISFYSFPPDGIQDPNEFATKLNKLWKPFQVLGRVYVAQEGVNAQMSVPTNVFENFQQCCLSIPELGVYMENGINVDPVPIPMADFPTAGEDGKHPPFKNLHLRVRLQIVADGLLETDKTLDFQSAGYDMPPLEWHDKVKQAKERREICGGDAMNTNSSSSDDESSSLPVILDCRNQYETGVGRFETAEPVNTENFRDTWDILQERLEGVPKDAPIMTYCTGGKHVLSLIGANGLPFVTILYHTFPTFLFV